MRTCRPLRAYNVQPNEMRRLKVKSGLLYGVYSDEKVDLRDRERLELLESLRHPRERDFYQDHTYHNQWVWRDLERHQKQQLTSRYRFFAPDYEIKPWLWYPGDTVEVVSGEGVGQRGTIVSVIKYKNEIIVQNINVQDVVIPASESRPEQVVQREHPISVNRVCHVDPSTNALCHLELVKVRNKETGKMEEKRMSLESGVLLPIPPIQTDLEVGDPLKDTPIQDADEPTYDRESEMAVLVQRRLHAMENYFVQCLKNAYDYHEPLRLRNAEDMRQFQSDVVNEASIALGEKLLDMAASTGRSALPSEWWDSIEAHIEDIRDEEEEERLRQESAEAEANKEEEDEEEREEVVDVENTSDTVSDPGGGS
ncbi:hypothetical protein ERJ75_001598300 [Trypanosoma vivax]|nr:hypothetical protein ERJ75_001598300 [Trypanosoma vivax]